MRIDAGSPLRADARRNRDQIIGAATALFAELGPEAPLEAVARHAGVGIGTLYRRFADRDTLVRAVVRSSLAAVLAGARTARDEERCAWDALVRALQWSPELGLMLRLVDRASPATTAALRADPELWQTVQQLTRVIDELVHAAQAEGSLRGDVSTGDVVLLSSTLSQAQSAAGDRAEAAFARARAVVLAGLRAPATAPLPGDPVPLADVLSGDPSRGPGQKTL